MHGRVNFFGFEPDERRRAFGIVPESGERRAERGEGRGERGASERARRDEGGRAGGRGCGEVVRKVERREDAGHVVSRGIYLLVYRDESCPFFRPITFVGIAIVRNRIKKRANKFGDRDY